MSAFDRGIPNTCLTALHHALTFRFVPKPTETQLLVWSRPNRRNGD